MSVEVNWLAVLLAALSTMAVGSIWYAKNVFGTKWKKLVGMTDAKAGKGAGKAIIITVIVSLISAYVLAYITFIANQYFGNSFLQDAITTAFWLWLGFTASRIITHDAFEQRPTELTLMNIAHEFVTFMVMAVIIGLIGL